MTLDWDAFKTWSILVVEDEPDNAELIVGTVQFYGATVKSAEHGAEALEILKEFTPTLILADLSMPKMDGWIMRSRLKDDPRTAHIPVVAISAHAMEGDKEKALAAGFDGYLSKPINIVSFVRDLRAAMEEKAALIRPQETGHS